MGENSLEVGNKIDLNPKVGRVLKDDETRKTYASQILDFQPDGSIVAAMPIQEEHLIPLEVGSTYEAYFYTSKGIMRAECMVEKRGKEGKIYIMNLILTTQLVKFQRREFYRLDCTIECKATCISSIEALCVAKNHTYPEDIDERLENAILVDISGGGARIISKIKYEKFTYLVVRFPIQLGDENKEITLLGRVILSLESDNNREYYDNRIQFKEISKEQREDIVKYIFEQQRKIRRKERG